jgi:DNA-binding NtrC family response regulator
MTLPKRNLVMIDDDRLLCDTIRQTVTDMAVAFHAAHTGSQGLRLCADMQADVVLLDQKLPDGDGTDFCGPIMDCNERTKIIFITGYPSFDHAVKAIKAGAYDYLSKPFELGELLLTLKHALRTVELEHVEQIQDYHQKQESSRFNLIGTTGGLKEVQHLVDLSAGSRAPVLITGETGTGKTMVARAVHYRSQAAGQAFIPINCAAIPENLMEAELFGYEKGAFTGAVTAKKGLFEMAAGGTLFLDEIGEIPQHLQSKLLGVLDDGQIRRLGGQSLKPVRARVIAATNADIGRAVAERKFREDLYYRLSVVHIHVPPLRERLKDLPDLCRFFLSRIAPDQVIHLPEEQIRALQAYAWPGNVRELRNIIERAVLVRMDSRIEPAGLLSQHGIRCTPAQSHKPPEGIKTLQAMELEHIQRALCYFNDNHTHTAKALGVSRSTLMRKLKIYGLG